MKNLRIPYCNALAMVYDVGMINNEDRDRPTQAVLWFLFAVVALGVPILLYVIIPWLMRIE